MYTTYCIELQGYLRKITIKYIAEKCLCGNYSYINLVALKPTTFVMDTLFPFNYHRYIFNIIHDMNINRTRGALGEILKYFQFFFK